MASHVQETHSDLAQYMNLKNVKLNANIDWIKIRISTAKPSNPQSIKAFIDKALPGSNTYVEAIGGSSNNTASVFEFRIQDANYTLTNRLLTGLEEKWGPLVDVQLLAVELAVDFYTKGKANPQDQRELLIQLVRGHSSLDRRNFRATQKNKNAQKIILANDLRTAVEVESTLMSGNKEDKTLRIIASPVYHRYYIKRTDNNGTIKLPPVKHRVRVEVGLSAESMPFKTMKEFRDYDFAKLAKHFNFRKEAPSSPKLIRLVRSMLPNIGTPKHVELAPHLSSTLQLRRTTANHTVADGELNGRCRDALRSMTRSHKRSIRA
jgi:hypothetical protein